MKRTRYIEFGRKGEQCDFFVVQYEFGCFRFLIAKDRVSNEVNRLRRDLETAQGKIREHTGKLYAALREFGGKA